MESFGILELLASIAEIAAKSGSGSASLVGCYQPKEPHDICEKLKKSKPN